MPRRSVPARSWSLAILIGLLAVLLPAGLLPASPAQAASGTLTGPDVASYQHPNAVPIDWPAVKRSGQSWAFVKATEGIGYTNPYFAADWRGSAAAGLYRGTYHYARPDPAYGSAIAQADFFAATIGSQRIPGTLPPALDLEDAGGRSPQDLQRWVQTFLDELQAKTGRLPMLYTYPNFWQTKMASSTAFTRYPLWIANYEVTTPQTIGWPDYTFWQSTSKATVDGIPTPGNTDSSRFNGSALDLAVLALEGTWGPATSTAEQRPQPDQTSAGRYVALTPERVVDTGRGLGAPRRAVNGSLTVTLPPSIPADSTGVVLDVSAVQATGPGFVRVAPYGVSPETTALNYAPGRSTTNLVVTAMDAQRQITLTTYGTPVNLVVDAVGYYTKEAGSGGRWVPLAPLRVADTRSPGPGVPSGSFNGSATLTLPDSVPTDVVGVALNVTALRPDGPGYLRLAAAGAVATTTALNFDDSGSTTGLALTRASNGKVVVTVHGSATGLVVDLLGYYEGSSASTSGGGYVALTPQRFLNTRTGLGATGPGNGPLTMTLPSSVPASATAVLLNVSVVDAARAGYLQLAVPGTEAATTTLNLTGRRNETVLALVPIQNGQITLVLYGTDAHLTADLVGFQVPAQN